ncbi:serine/threonine protein kinase [Achlya hypogyna]|uniref:Serine/threonine protein kinase n=1 Tax=Achlya hypogyna TaxID=1202772 RepID=A0A1V9ZSA2_ACHHY|nr:serine/threonine protein kinase [Achlya hypogyna]
MLRKGYRTAFAMENYNIYDEIGRGTHSSVYKARRKRSIEYVAVKSTAKGRMAKILNEVQLLHKLASTYVLKFYNWYESSNHIWIIFEYCIGGDLLKLIAQDKTLPESSIQTFGHDLVCGLHYLHTNGVIYCDLKPANVLIDEYGSLKLADFGLARRIPTTESLTADTLQPGSPHYMAPELFEDSPVHSFASDFWALGCVLYELRTGTQLFSQRDFNELRHTIQTVPIRLPQDDMSEVFCDLLERAGILQHPFWTADFDLAVDALPPQHLFVARHEETQVAPTPTRPLDGRRSPQAAPPPSSAAPQEPSPTKRSSPAKGASLAHLDVLSSDEDLAARVRPATAPEDDARGNQLTHDASSSPPRTAPAVVLARPPPSARLPTVELPTKTAAQRIFTTADCVVRPIVGCADIEAVAVPRWKEAVLPVVPAASFKAPGQLEAHLEQLYLFLRGDASASDKHNALAYLCSLVATPKIANVVANSSLLTLLVKLLDRSTSSALSTRLCLLLGLLVRHASFIGADALVSEADVALVPVLLRVLATAADALERRALACLGELAFYLSTQPAVALPTSLSETLVAALGAPDAVARHYATQAVCNVLTSPATPSALVQRFVQPRVVELVLRGVRAVDGNPTLRVATMQLLAQLLRHSPLDEYLARVVPELPRVWAGVAGDSRLSVAALNVLNCVVERSAAPVAVEAFVALPTVRALLQKKEPDDEAFVQLDAGRFRDPGGRLATLVQGKLLLLVYFGLQASRAFALAFVAANVLEDVERCLHATPTYVSHSAAQVVSLSVRIALELTFTLAAPTPAPELPPLLEKLLGGQLLRLPRCRQQFMAMLRANAHEELECLVLGTTELLKQPAMQASTIQLLLLVFAHSDIVTDGADDLWFDSALVEVAGLLYEPLAPDMLVSCIRVLFNALALLPPSAARDAFVMQSLLPAYVSLLHPGAHDIVTRFAVELLHDLVRRDPAYVVVLHRLQLVPAVLQLLGSAATLSASATQLVRLVQETETVPLAELYAMGLPGTLAHAASLCEKEALRGCASDVCHAMYAILYAHYLEARTPSDADLLDFYRSQHCVLVDALPTLLQISGQAEDDAQDQASRCVSLLCQVRGDLYHNRELIEALAFPQGSHDEAPNKQ